MDSIYENAAMAAEGGASWLTIHARTRVQGYAPPVFWKPIGRVRHALGLPVIANGDIWTVDDFKRCQDETGCIHYMIGRSALADPGLSCRLATELGLQKAGPETRTDWLALLKSFAGYAEQFGEHSSRRPLMRLKQWLKIATLYGAFPHFDGVKQTQSVDEFFTRLAAASA